MTALPTFASGHEINNADRAEMVRPLVQQFHDAYYWHPGGEPWATVIGDLIADLIADLGHLFDRLGEEHRDPLRSNFDDLLTTAYRDYEFERDEEGTT